MVYKYIILFRRNWTEAGVTSSPVGFHSTNGDRIWQSCWGRLLAPGTV